MPLPKVVRDVAKSAQRAKFVHLADRLGDALRDRPIITL